MLNGPETISLSKAVSGQVNEGLTDGRLRSASRHVRNQVGNIIMTKFVRLAALAAAATIVATPAVAAPVCGQPDGHSARARIVKPLTLTAQRDLDFGTVVCLTGDGTVSISQAGAGTCSPAADADLRLHGRARRPIIT